MWKIYKTCHGNGRSLDVKTSKSANRNDVSCEALLLLALAKANPHICKAILRGADKDLLHCLSECAHNILQGNVKLKPSDKARLSKYRQKLWKLAEKRGYLKQKHKIIQTGGFTLLFWPLNWHHCASMLWGRLAPKGAVDLLQGVLDKI